MSLCYLIRDRRGNPFPPPRESYFFLMSRRSEIPRQANSLPADFRSRIVFCFIFASVVVLDCPLECAFASTVCIVDVCVIDWAGQVSKEMVGCVLDFDGIYLILDSFCLRVGCVSRPSTVRVVCGKG
ncbi:hypothetical protein BDU57DRAFT_510153 [Ampelomyces quisqualis]|uniref:Uncharacterized protein n=1 Tax=Ampelomyces quisqualis TaxID=50730 RepID=A0A6A5R2J8_AMPQU|nr:hypothetical protein BDU57DRAFT_510153 [Ampelomyces quisqualis]